ncbi:hypothetical protein [Paraburkholderia atlantica]|uniref:hypothetical protein n=1 Tax=Paraburkholderia atlantica TaxID=2654982 RepID=UPI00160C8A5E|nr:hypothetical protein [Paraburkholderia atlantica]MBB5509599.1 hypothetical protein [Paraburkholderia atlantica]
MSEQEFEMLFTESLLKLDMYIATQITKRQIFQAKGRRHHVERNKAFWKHQNEKGEPLVLCKQCGAIESSSYCEPYKTQIIERGLCYHCNSWTNEIAKDDPKRLVIDGHIYGDGGNQPNASRKDFLGFGGHVWTIERDGKVWQTNNLWSGSTVPAEYRDRMPDNARFVKASK